MKRLFSIILTGLLFLTAFTFSSANSAVQAEDDHPLLNGVVSDAAIVIDRDTDQILDEKNADAQIYPASMTKMMTAILAIEKLPDLNQTVTITSDTLAGLAEANATVAGFQPGDTPTVQDLLYGIALPSGADASNAAVDLITDNNRQAFIAMMNEKAEELGMDHTNFVNDTGLHDDNHYSTVRDIAKLLKYCLQNETFQKIFSAKSYRTSSLSSAPEGILLHSSMWSAARREDYPVPGLTGGKTGYTVPAGHCLASWSDVNNMHVMMVTAHADTPINQMTHLQDANTILTSLQGWSKQTLIQKNDRIGSITVHHLFHDETIDVRAPETVQMDLPANTAFQQECSIPTTASADIRARNLNGSLTITSADQTLYTKKLQVRIPAETNIIARIILRIQKLFH